MPAKKLTIDDYEITKDGQVINKITQHILKGQPNNKGYLRVHIDGKLRFIHRLVAEKYIPNPNNLEQVNHINGNKTDNRVENLEWVDNLTNRHHAVENGLHLSGEQCSYAKLNWDKVRFIRENRNLYTTVELAEMFGVKRTTISSVLNNRSWKEKNS